MTLVPILNLEKNLLEKTKRHTEIQKERMSYKVQKKIGYERKELKTKRNCFLVKNVS